MIKQQHFLAYMFVIVYTKVVDKNISRHFEVFQYAEPDSIMTFHSESSFTDIPSRSFFLSFIPTGGITS